MIQYVYKVIKKEKRMFISNNERIGTCYFEFQFCKNKNPIKVGKVNANKIKHKQEDSLFLTDDEFDKFYKLYGEIFKNALFPNGDRGFDMYGVNYYDRISSSKILLYLTKNIDKKYIQLIEWLKISVNTYNRFYILGI